MVISVEDEPTGPSRAERGSGKDPRPDCNMDRSASGYRKLETNERTGNCRNKHEDWRVMWEDVGYALYVNRYTNFTQYVNR